MVRRLVPYPIMASSAVFSGCRRGVTSRGVAYVCGRVGASGANGSSPSVSHSIRVEPGVQEHTHPLALTPFASVNAHVLGMQRIQAMPTLLFAHATGLCKEIWGSVIRDLMDIPTPMNWLSLDFRGHGDSVNVRLWPFPIGYLNAACIGHSIFVTLDVSQRNASCVSGRIVSSMGGGGFDGCIFSECAMSFCIPCNKMC